jgi:ABC-type multidrug transport system fused ATPase/permease subunit
VAHAGDGLVEQQPLDVLDEQHADLQPLFPAVREDTGERVALCGEPGRGDVRHELGRRQAGYGRSIVLHGVSVAAPADGVAAVMGHSGAGVLTQLLPRRAGLLSGGRRQQLAIARALVTGPELVGFALRAAERS